MGICISRRAVLQLASCFITATLILSQGLILKQGQFIHYRNLDDQICSSETDDRIENVPTEITCGRHCLASAGCRSFFYNADTGQCVLKVNEDVFHQLTAGADCQPATNTVYFYDINAVYGPAGYTWYSAGGYFFKFNSTCMTWVGARDQCRAEGAGLLMLKTVEERSYFVNIVDREYDSDGGRCGQYNVQGVWFGATDAAVEGTWEWVDGSLANSSLADFWKPGEPNNWDNLDNCLQLRKTSGDWNFVDAFCNHVILHVSGFLCAVQN